MRRILNNILQLALLYLEFGWLKIIFSMNADPHKIIIQLKVELKIALLSKSILNVLL